MPIYFTNNYSGTIGNSTIQPQFIRQNSKLFGSYMLLNKMYLLEGTINIAGNFFVNESSNGKPTGKWEGSISTSGDIVGDWSKYNRNQKGTLFLTLQK